MARPPKNWSTLRRATSANSSRRSYDDTRPCGPTARSSEQVRAPEPTPASTTWAPGKMSAMRDDLGGVLGVDDRGAARHRDDELARAAAGRRGTRPPADEVTVKPSSRPIRSSWSRWPLLEKNRLPGSRQKLCRRPLLSTRRTHSPARSGPRWTPDQASAVTSGLGVGMARNLSGPRSAGDGAEGPIDVGGGEHAVDRAVVLDEEVLRGRAAG